MRVLVHIGLPHCGAELLQAALDQNRAQVLRKGVLYSSAAGRKNHTRLYMAVLDPDHVDPLRFARGFASAEAQDRLRNALTQELQAEAANHPDAKLLVLSAPQLATLTRRTELERLKTLLAAVSDDVTILAHVDEQARVLLRHYYEALRGGRVASLTQELALAGTGAAWDPETVDGWRSVAVASAQDCPEIQAAPHWLDYVTLVARWQQVFGQDKVILRPYEPSRFQPGTLRDELGAMLGITFPNKAAEVSPTDDVASDITLARWRQINIVLTQLIATGRVVRRPARRALEDDASVPGPPPEAGALSAVSRRFEADNAALLKAHPALTAACLQPEPERKPWAEPDPAYGFRATQYVARILPQINAATAKTQEVGAQQTGAQATGAATAGLSLAGERLLSERAKEIFHSLRGGRFAPRNEPGVPDETSPAPAFAEIAPRQLPSGSTGKVIVGCMKNEAPYILEWIAYHRQIGVDNFLIYTNDCSDGTHELLDRLQALGIVQHRLNNDWKGNSPQQHALNKAMQEDMVRDADWLIHIDVDEFINVRTGNGTLDDFLAHVPDATNVAMTWRMFGSNRVGQFEDRLVISQFDHAAPRYCPKPHTSWGFKTMTRNMGAYTKLACHRPNKLVSSKDLPVQWVNGSGAVMAPRYHDKGWRSDPGSVGYDMLQLNHYALRSAESFLVKRDRGRALHVDRSIGLNYWIRMDWSANRDLTIGRNIPRVETERNRLLSDPELLRLHMAGVAWHKAKAAELHSRPEFEDLYQQVLTIDLTDMERVALALALEIDD